MTYRLLATFLLFLAPLSANAVYFPDGIDWTNPSQNRFVQSLYLNALGRAPDAAETRAQVRALRKNDNRTARLRIFESIIESQEYRRTFNNNDQTWKVYQAPDYNYNNGVGYVRYQAAATPPDNFRNIPSGRSFTPSIAQSFANYYDAFCYRGDPCINNPELARDRGANVLGRTTSRRTHACASPENLTSQFKWVAINGTTYPRGIGRETICMQDAYFEAKQLTLQHYQCEPNYENCKRNPELDLRASRSGNDNSGKPSLFFRDGSRLTLMDEGIVKDNAGVLLGTNSDNELLLDGDQHECADPSQATSRFQWRGPAGNSESTGIGANIICMDNHYYAVQRLTLYRHQCRAGFIDCQPDPNNNIKAERRTKVDGKPGLLFANGTTLSLVARGVVSNDVASTTVDAPAAIDTQSQLQVVRGSDCAISNKRLSQFRWKSNGLSSWPDGVGGQYVCLNDSYYEINPTKLSHYSCQRNYSNCRSNPRKDINITRVSDDGLVWQLSNGDELTLVSR